VACECLCSYTCFGSQNGNAADQLNWQSLIFPKWLKFDCVLNKECPE